MKSEANLQPIRQDKVDKEHDSAGCSTCNAVIANKNNRRCIVKKTFAENCQGAALKRVRAHRNNSHSRMDCCYSLSEIFHRAL